MTMPPLPAQGSTAWYGWASAAHAAAEAVTTGRLTDDALRAASVAAVQDAIADGVIDAGGTTLTVDGVEVPSYNLDTTPPTAADVGAYSQAETDEAIADAVAGVGFLGISAFDVGNIESVTRAPGFNDKTLGSGTLWVQHFTAPRTTNPIVSLGYPARATAPTGITLARMALFTVAANGDLTKVAQTANFTPVGTFTDQVQPLSTAGGFPASYVCQAGQRYAIGLLVVGTQAGNAHGWDIPGAGNKPTISRRASGQTDIADTYASGALSDYFEGLYLFGRHATG